MWSNPKLLPQYYPLTATSFALDYQLWGTWTFPFHLENVLLQFLAAMLLWQLLLRLAIPGAWLASAIFAVHPVMVESVAWITERKNVLSIVFYLGALLLYERYKAARAEVTNDSSPATRGDGVHPSATYILAAIFFLAALLAKTAVLTLPAVILLMDWWKTGRIRWREDVVPVLPLFALAAGLGAVTYWMERNNVGAQGVDFTMTPAERILVAGHVFWFYLAKLFWPVNLCFVYPRWQLDAHMVWPWLYPIAAVGLLITLWALRGWIGRGPATAVFYFAGTLLPVMGFVNVYSFRYSYVWDHLAYLSDMGIVVLAAATLTWWAQKNSRFMVAYGFAGVVLPLFTLLSWRHAATFTGARTAWEKTLVLNPDCALAHANIGALDLQQGDNVAAMKHFGAAIGIKPDFYEALFNYGLALADQGHLDEAMAKYRQAIEIHPTFAPAYNSLGYALARKKEYGEAIKNYQEALSLDPHFGDAHHNLGLAFFNTGQFREAMQEFREATRLSSESDYQQDLHEAASILDMNNEAWTLATSPDPAARDGQRAVELAEHACKNSHYEQPMLLGTLAAAYAEAGRFDDAVRTADKACELGAALGETNLVQRNQELIRLYKAHQAYHEPAGAGPIKD